MESIVGEERRFISSCSTRGVEEEDEGEDEDEEATVSAAKERNATRQRSALLTSSESAEDFTSAGEEVDCDEIGCCKIFAGRSGERDTVC